MQSPFGEFPLLGGAVVFTAYALVPSGELGFILHEAVRVQRIDSELQATDNFVFDLPGRAEDVGIVLSKSSNTE
jgi:hypothetical protein